jgi:5-carboxymethyl-2-hydroxymuconate isomerase
MPHLTIEISENTRLACSQEELLDEANVALLASGHFEESAIKSRCITLNTFRIGVEPVERAFIHARLHILDGRELAVRQAISKSICEIITDAVRPEPNGSPVQITVEVIEMERASFTKQVVAPSK